MEDKILIKCVENRDFCSDVEACGESFILNEDKVYSFETINYFGEPIKYYYTICPNCGHLTCVDEKFLSLEDKLEAELRSTEYYILKKNRLRGSLIHIDYMEEMEKERVKKRMKTL